MAIINSENYALTVLFKRLKRFRYSCDIWKFVVDLLHKTITVSNCVKQCFHMEMNLTAMDTHLASC